MQPTDERWLPIAGYGTRYEVSDQGRVRSLAHWVDPGGGRKLYYRATRVLGTKGAPYATVNLYRNGTPRTFGVHILVAQTFIGPVPSGYEVRHLNDHKLDNRLVNIAIGTVSENRYDAVRNGHHPKAAQTHCKRGHPFTPENTRIRTNPYHRECRACRRMLRQQSSIARATGEESCDRNQTAWSPSPA